VTARNSYPKGRDPAKQGLGERSAPLDQEQECGGTGRRAPPQSRKAWDDKKGRLYEPRIVGDKVMMPADLKRLPQVHARC
jgi:hypothetical protein